MLRKRMISILLVMCMIVSLLSNVGITAQATEYQVSERSEKIDTNVKAAAKAGESNDGSTDVEITKQTYEDLGLELNENIGNNVPEPINTNGRNNPTVVNSAREIYAAANGSKGNRYTLRNGFNKMGEDRVWDTTDISDSNGTMYGAYKYWDINNSDDLEGKSGKTHYSQLSENDNKGTYDVNSMYKDKNGFYGIYATSTEFNAGEGKDNYIAELRAYSNDTKSTVDGKEIKGKIGVQLYKVQDATGKRTEVGFLDAGAGDNLVVNKKSGSSYALKERMKIYAGNKDTFGDGWNGFNGQPVVTIAGGDLSGDGKDEICITVSAPTESTTVTDNSKISITAPGNMTYGKNTKLSVVQLSGGDENTQENVTSTVDYFVEKLSDVTNKYETATDEEYTMEAGVFTPKTTGRFNITAKKDNVSDSAVIHVDKGLITISADDQTSSVNKERNDLTASIVGYASFDESKINNLTPGTDYEMQSDAISTDAAGDYIVYPVLKNTDKMQDLQNLYSIILEKGLYTLTSSAYEVNVETDTKGTAEIKYETTGRSIKVKTGDLVPENSRVIIEATPKEGYSIAGWQVDGNLVEESGTVVKDSLYTIDSLTSDKNIKVLFEDITSKVSYKVHADEQDKLNGTVRGTYSTVDGYEFSSGSQLAYKQSIVVQAQPNEGYVVDHWTIQSGDEIATVIKAEDGINSYTGSTYTFTKLTKDTQIEVYFAKQTTIPVSLKFVDGEGIAMKDKVSVNINGTDITSDSEGVFHYDGINGDNLCIQVNVPENLLVNSWNVSDGQSTGTLSNDNKTMNIYNLQKETDFVVQTDAFNTYEVSFTTKVDDDSDATKAGMLIATKRSTSEEIVSGTAHIQGSAIELNATPKLGYEIKEWLVNGKVVQGEAKENGVQSYTVSSLSADTTVVVVFRKNVEFIDLKVQSGKNGTVVTKVGVENQLEEIDATNGVEIPAGNIVEIKATPADGYMVKNWTVNDVVQSDKSNVLTLADVKEDTVIKVTYQLIVLYNLPVNGTDYTITDIKRNPDEYGTGTGTNGADQIRDGGNVSFKLTPTQKEGKTVTVKAIKIFGVDCANDKNEYPVKANNGSLITSVMNTDGSYAITVDNVKADMNLDVTLQYQDESSKEQNKDEGNKEQNKDESNKEEVATKCVVNYSALDNGKLVVKTPEGTAIENGASVDVGTTLVCAATPDEYYELDTLNVNNKAVNPSRNGNEYLYTIVTEASVPVVTIEASFVVAKDLGFDDADKFENFKVKAVGKNKAIKVTWAKIPEADGYYVYGTKCKTEFKKIKTITNPSKVSFTQKNLKKGQYYKYKLAAYKTIDGKNYIIANSIDVHAVTKGGKYADPTKIKVNKTKINLRKGKKATIKASYTIQKGKKQALHISKFRYESTDKTIATVNKKGVVKGIKKGTAYIYVYAQNGVYKKVKVTVK